MGASAAEGEQPREDAGRVQGKHNQTDAQIAKIDQAFVLPPEHRPGRREIDPEDNNSSIPVIDLAPIIMERNEEEEDKSEEKQSEARKAIVQEVRHACTEWGFFQVVNHDIPKDVILGLKKTAREFFELPLEEKRKVRRTQDNAMGYNDQELTKNVRDWKEVFDIAVSGVLELPADFHGDRNITNIFGNQWPDALPSLRGACEVYVKEAERLSFFLLELISESLGLERCRFNDYFKNGTTMFRLNHYPACPSSELALGVSRHKDVGALTVLLQDEVGGLQVKRKDGQWIDVKPDPFAPVINVGDMIQVYSNDTYYSVEHRVVVNENKDRYSFPLFFNPIHSTDIHPLGELISEQQPARYKPIQWGRYLKSRKDSNYKNLGVENLQISHYAING